MGEFFTQLDEKLEAFIAQQAMFFVATAPNAGRVSLSPKGIDTFRVVDTNTVAYLDLTGSGNETAAHLAENGRITIMFCSFGAKPLILRLYGQGRVVRPRDADWQEWLDRFGPMPGQRQIMVVNVEQVQTSCGYGVPRYELIGQRDTMIAWAEKKGPEGIHAYWEKENQVSIDGLPTHILE